MAVECVATLLFALGLAQDSLAEICEWVDDVVPREAQWAASGLACAIKVISVITAPHNDSLQQRDLLPAFAVLLLPLVKYLLAVLVTASLVALGYYGRDLPEKLESAETRFRSLMAPSTASKAMPEKERRRDDIQVLRALAVSVVVLFHLGLPWAKGGFVGVDVFFVISGFLVFGSVVHGLCKNEFSLVEFVARRAKRLNPPSAVMLVLLVAFLWRSTYCMYNNQCGRQMTDVFWASLQVANIHLMTQRGGYFVESSPSIVLHYWSLSVEEQLYILVPVIGPVLGVTSLLSFAVMFAQPSKWRFYFVASRYWEFGLGALVAHYASFIHENKFSFLRPTPCKLHWIALYVAAWASMIVASVLTPNDGYPNALTLPVCLAAALVIACKFEVRAPGLKQLGDVSYSVYLYHWPIIVLCRLYVGLTVAPWTTSGNSFFPPALRVNSFGATSFYQDPWVARLNELEDPSDRLFHRTRRVALAVNGDSHVMQIWRLLFGYGQALNATFWNGGVSHGSPDRFEAMWNPPALWSADNYDHRLTFLSFRHRFGQFPRWEDDFKRYARQWIRRSTCTVFLQDNPIFVDADRWELPSERWPIECLRTSEASACAYDQRRVLESPEVGWVRDILRESPEHREAVDMVSFNDLVCWEGMCHSHVHDVPVFADSNHYTAQYVDYARNFMVARLRSSPCFAEVEALMGASAAIESAYGPAAQHRQIL
eukprot:m51a1_g10742 hypothetical protein (712) ;mRNA; f:330124-335749